MGFPPLWIVWIRSLLISSTSYLKINDIKGEPFYHRKGLRQGDPLSPLLFIIAVDSLQAMIQNLNDDLINLPMAKTTLFQFADDTTIIMPAHATNVKIIMATLDSFARASGLQINLNKSGFLPIVIPQHLIPTLASLIRCGQLSTLIQYLGLPLTVKKPPKPAYLPLINNVQKRYKGFRAKYLTRAGRTVLANSVLNAIPLHYMQAFLLPKWVINRINRITRHFIWRGNENTYSRGHCLVAWPKLTLLKTHGGLGIMDLSLQNKTLLVKWIWLAETDEACLWALTLRSLHLSIGKANEGNDDHLSYFLKDLTTLLPYYKPSIQFNQDERTISWRWGETFTARSMYKTYNNLGIEQNHLARI
jgi:ribosomal protein L34